MPKSTTRSDAKVKRILANADLRAAKKRNGGKGARELRRAADPTLKDKALQAEARRVAAAVKAEELRQKAERLKKAEQEAAAARLAVERLKLAHEQQLAVDHVRTSLREEKAAALLEGYSGVTYR